MSEYQALKARALEMQREKEEAMKMELAAKQEREKQLAREQEERRKRLEEASKEARRRELMRAHEELNRKTGGAGNRVSQAEYDPFAEDVKPIATANIPKPSARSGPSKISKTSLNKPASSSSTKASTSNKSGNSKNGGPSKGSSPPVTAVLGRKEKAARLFAQKAKKSAADSLFSVRSLVESREPAQVRVTPRAGPSKVPPTSMKTEMRGKANGGGRNAAVRSRLMMNGKEELRKLCPDRDVRDRRSIDEISRDLKAKRLLTDESSPQKNSRPLTASMSKLSIPSSKAREKRPISNPPSEKRRRYSLDDSTDSESESSSSRQAKRRPKKRSRSPPSQFSEPSAAFISAEIQALFRRPGRSGPKYADDFSDASSDDMEAGLSDVEIEERRAAKIARLEDEAAEKEEREHKLRKEALKKQKLKGGKA
ncbi:hypothetical protein CNBA2020 [Cryptococcus deneoformans B-3501A]|uniref:hypothetical protein n=1 Tax=Cryptococcus deneoformans (strain B-3501A) TaxID=283643 RepID=UPI000042CFB5|nr:hypothetical protein CNBA2020 [Cryptococcus neoformans var. neoformans B-3501A]EAL23555.1 hypothetical protein CNBA2020 [Cryptococcus neoformans var. neoformans B-3501A]